MVKRTTSLSSECRSSAWKRLWKWCSSSGSFTQGTGRLISQKLKFLPSTFFAGDRLVYAHKIPLYLAATGQMKKTDVKICEEFFAGNWVVKTYPAVPFCTTDADNILEHVNLSMKVSKRLISSTLNSTTDMKFLLISPGKAWLAEGTHRTASLSSASLCQKRRTETSTLTSGA